MAHLSATPGQADLPDASGAGPGAQTSKNWMGIVGLIASIVCCFQIVGLIFGILGLKAVKNGEATNRGMAMFAVWWSGLWIAVALVLTVMFALDPDGRSRDFIAIFGDAGADVAAIDEAIHAVQDDNPGQYVTAIGWDGQNYYVGDVVVEAQSGNPTIRFFTDGRGGHCIEILSGTSSANLAHGASCIGTPQPVLTP